jgi:hypothetical protein
VRELKKADSNELKEYTVLLNVQDQSGEEYVIQRRYSEFCSLHMSLLKAYANHMTNVILPPKIWFGNFNPGLIERRRQALEKYLVSVVDNVVLRQSQHFVEFCSCREIEEASAMTRVANYEKAHRLFQRAFKIQSWLLGDSHPVVVETCCFLAAVVFERGLLEEVTQYSEMALRLLEQEEYRKSICLAPLIRLMIKTYRHLDRLIDATRLELWLGQMTTSAHEKSLLQLAAA